MCSFDQCPQSGTLSHLKLWARAQSSPKQANVSHSEPNPSVHTSRLKHITMNTVIKSEVAKGICVGCPLGRRSVESKATHDETRRIVEKVCNSSSRTFLDHYMHKLMGLFTHASDALSHIIENATRVTSKLWHVWQINTWALTCTYDHCFLI